MMKTKTEKSGFDSSAGASVEPLWESQEVSGNTSAGRIVWVELFSNLQRVCVVLHIFRCVTHRDTHTHSHHLSPSLHSTQ